MNQRRFTIPFRLFKGLSHGCIIGNKTLCFRKAKIDYSSLEVMLHCDQGEPCSIPVSVGEIHGKLQTTQIGAFTTMSIEIPSQTQMILPVNIRYHVQSGPWRDRAVFYAPTNVLFEGNSKLVDMGLMIPRCLCVSNGDEIHIPVTNVTNSPVKVGKWKNLGNVAVTSEEVVIIAEYSRLFNGSIEEMNSKTSGDDEFEAMECDEFTALTVDDEGWLNQSKTQPQIEKEQQIQAQILERISPNLTQKQRDKLYSLIWEFRDLIPDDTSRPTRTPLGNGTSY